MQSTRSEMTTPPRQTARRAVPSRWCVGPHRTGRGPHRADRQRRAGRVLDAIEAARRRASTACACTRCTPCTTGLPARRVRRPPAPRLLLPVPRHPALLRTPAPSTSSPTTSARCATSSAAAPPTRWSLAAASPIDRHGYFSLGVQRRLRGVVHRPGPLLPRGQPRRCRAPSAATSSTSARSWAGPRPTARWSRCRRPLPGRVDAAIAALVAERIPERRHAAGRHRRHPQRRSSPRSATTATSASTPSCSPTA